MSQSEVTANLWIARFLRDRELQLELEAEQGDALDIEDLQLEECVFGNDPYNSIGKHVRS